MLKYTEYEHMLDMQTDAFKYDIQKKKHMFLSIFIASSDLHVERTVVKKIRRDGFK